MSYLNRESCELNVDDLNDVAGGIPVHWYGTALLVNPIEGTAANVKSLDKIPVVDGSLRAFTA
jgi:hypothetical protein